MSQQPSTLTEDALQAGLAEHRAGRLDAAKAFYGQALACSPEDPNAMHLMGMVSVQMGDHATGVGLLQRSVALTPGNAEFAVNLARVLKNVGRPAEAAQALRAIVEAAPAAGSAHLELADILRDSGDLDGAEAHYRRALEWGADRPATLSKLAGVLINSGREEEGEACFRQALDINPTHAPSLNNLGLLLVNRGRVDEAVDCHWRAAAVVGQEPNLWYNLGNALKARNDLAEARDAYARAIDIDPDHADAHLHMGYTWLLEGEFAPGWDAYEWRWRAETFPTPPTPGIPWDGAPLDGGIILLTAEQGLGDTIQFARYAPMVADRGGRVVLRVPPPLERLLAGCPGVERVLTTDETPGDYCCHAPLMSLPRLFGTRLDKVPAAVPYLAADADAARSWAARLAGNPHLKVGIVWRGLARHNNDHNRSCPLEAFLPLAAVPGVDLFSLQKTPADDDLPLPDGIRDLAGDLGDFADTAAAVDGLDLVVTVDTAVAHLAGAMAKPVWVLLPESPDWRWMLDREDSPWYPTMRLYRQARRGDWEGVLARVAGDLDRMAGGP